MIDFLFSQQVAPFSITLCIMFALALLEGTGVILGFGFFSFLDNILPDIDIDMDIDLEYSSGGLTSFMSWMNVGKVPLLAVIICFLSAFGLVGVMGQYILQSFLGFLAPLILTLPSVFLLSLPLTKYSTAFIHKIMPKDESTALSMDSFVGKEATITLGKASKDFPAECRLEDKYGQTHYFMVEPEEEGVVFEQGESILLSKAHKTGFYAIKNNYNTLHS